MSAFVETCGRRLLHEHPFVADVTAARPVGVEEPLVDRVEDVPLAGQLGEHQRTPRIRHLFEALGVRQSRLREHRIAPVGEPAAIAALELGARDSLGRVLRVQVEGSPLDPRAEPALQPRRPLEADVAERSDVVAPDLNQRHVFGSLGHSRSA